MHPENNARRSELIELLQVKSINLIVGNNVDVKKSDVKGYLCNRCRRWSAEKQDELCNRCEKTVELFYSK